MVELLQFLKYKTMWSIVLFYPMNLSRLGNYSVMNYCRVQTSVKIYGIIYITVSLYKQSPQLNISYIVTMQICLKMTGENKRKMMKIISKLIIKNLFEHVYAFSSKNNPFEWKLSFFIGFELTWHVDIQNSLESGQWYAD